jgi:hypothetical protein
MVHTHKNLCRKKKKQEKQKKGIRHIENKDGKHKYNKVKITLDALLKQ